MFEMRSMVVDEHIHEIIGDIPVPHQLDAALGNKVGIDEYNKLLEEVNALKADVKRLFELVGDTPVPEQIMMAVNNR